MLNRYLVTKCNYRVEKDVDYLLQAKLDLYFQPIVTVTFVFVYLYGFKLFKINESEL